MKNIFEKNKTYYYPEMDCKIKYLGESEGNPSVMGSHYKFRILGNEYWDELETTIPNEIFKNKTQYNKYLKLQKNK